MKINGKKTYIAGGALILMGLAGGVLHFVAPEHGQAMGIQESIQLIAAGLGFVGVKHAISKK